MIEKMICAVSRRLTQFAGDKSGAALLLTGFLLTSMVGAVGLAMDVGAWYLAKRGMRAAVDGAALAAAQELIKPDFTASKIIAAAEKVADRNDVNAENDGTVDVTVAPDGQSVNVAITQPAPGYFAHALMISPPVIEVQATAGLVTETATGGNECVLVLDKKGAGTLWLKGKASISAVGCGIQVNSNDSNALKMNDNATITAKSICVVGQATGTLENITATITTDCAAVPDPLAGAKPPIVGECDYEETEINGGVHTLFPGVYCEGLEISGDAVVTLEPGNYIITEGRLKVSGNATVQGAGVGFYLADADAELDFSGDAFVQITAPTSGPLQGIVFFGNPYKPAMKHKILNRTNSTYTGTVYLKNTILKYKFDGKSKNVAPFLAMIVGKLELIGNAVMTVENNDAGGETPAPAGVETQRAVLLD